MAYKEKQLQDISKQFQIYGEILHAETFKIGHINETYTATYDQGGTRVRYIHQKINQNVFKNPAAVMKNLMRVTTHLRRRLEARNVRDLTRRSLVVIPTRDGQSYYRSPATAMSGARSCLSRACRRLKRCNRPTRRSRRAAPSANSKACSWICQAGGWWKPSRTSTTPGNALPPCSRPCRRITLTARQAARPEIEFALKHEPWWT